MRTCGAQAFKSFRAIDAWVVDACRAVLSGRRYCHKLFHTVYSGRSDAGQEDDVTVKPTFECVDELCRHLQRRPQKQHQSGLKDVKGIHHKYTTHEVGAIFFGRHFIFVLERMP